MRAETRLDSAVFQLTPTRTRCDLVITANGKTEKIASGLLNPFLAHLKAAQDEIAKGGYSITLEPDHATDATWFTKGTVERFVRFVSTPGVLERVNTIESEILQIDEAIAIQSNENLGLSTLAEEHQSRSSESVEGSKPTSDQDAEKAIVLFKPGAQPTESNGSTTQEEHSKVKLLKVLETRKIVLQKEQGMAFARAVAAGFEMDLMTHLISFAECFGASRLMNACLRFMELWKRKHETGQWVEIEAAEAMSSRSDFSAMNASGIMLSSEIRHCVHNELGAESNGKTSNDANADISSDNTTDKKLHADSPTPGSHEYFPGQFQHPMYPQWPVHSPPGAPVFQAYPMQGMPYYQNYPGGGPFFQSPYLQMEDPRFSTGQRVRQKRHSMDSKHSNDNSEAWDGEDQEIEKEVSRGRKPCRKAGHSGRKQSGKVVIKNINYITSKKHSASGSESESASEPESNGEAENVLSDTQEREPKSSVRSSRSKQIVNKSNDSWNSHDDVVYDRETDTGTWQAFQNCLLREDNEGTVGAGLFSIEKEAHVKRRQSATGEDPILPRERDFGEIPERRVSEFVSVNGKMTRLYKQNDELAISSEGFRSSDGRGLRDGHEDVQFTEIEGGGQGYRRAGNDDFMIYGRGHESGITNPLSDPLAGEQYGRVDKLDKISSHNVVDDSFIVSFRSNSQDQVGTDSRAGIDIESELPSALQKSESSANKIASQLNYEPDDLGMMPERGMERESIGYDPAVDYEMQLAEHAVVVSNRNGEDVVVDVKEKSKKSDKEKKSNLEKKNAQAVIKKGRPSKLNPTAEAQARAERLRAFKADLQKVKREKEEEELKRLEALKRERQKRIAARGSSTAAQSPVPSPQAKSRLPTKSSPSSLKGSKFSDSEPGSSSPIQKLPLRTASGSDSQKTTRCRRLSDTHLTGNGLSRSVSSLPELKKESNGVTPQPRAVSIQSRRLSDPKGSITHRASSIKAGNRDPAPKSKVSDEPVNKKISAIMNLDKTKSAALPELKITTSKDASEMAHNKSVMKEALQKGNGSRASPSSESNKSKKSNEKTLHHSNNGDENPVIEKTVVMLENGTAPVIQASEAKTEIYKGPYDDVTAEKSDAVLEYAAIHASPLPIMVGEVNQDPSEHQVLEHPSTHEVTTVHARDESPKFSGINATVKPYQAPHGRASSLEDPCTSNVDYNKEAPVSSGMGTNTETKAHFPDFMDATLQEQFLETLEKSRGKESSKGFRRLLKFGRKNHSSAASEQSDSDKMSVDGSAIDDHTATTASKEVHTLKNLISQYDSPVGGTPTKVSRSFSLLSPFRSKTSEKKVTA